MQILSWGARLATPSLQFRAPAVSLMLLLVDHDLNYLCNRIKVNYF